MGRVCRAFDTRLHRRVALKVLHLSEGVDAKEAVSTALREARAAAAIAHPNATAVYDADEIEGVPFIVMEFVPGTSLRQIISGPPVALSLRIRWLVDIAGALGAAHHVGIVHRDVKPENVMVREDGLVKVLDFGVARRTISGNLTHDSMSSEHLSTPDGGRLVGTPAYMPPEQIRGEPIDGRADQFAWGVVAYELLTGRLPWKTAREFLGYIAAVLTEKPEPPRTIAAEIPPAVEAAIVRTLSKNPANRFPSLAAAAAELLPFAQDPRHSAAAAERVSATPQPSGQPAAPPARGSSPSQPQPVERRSQPRDGPPRPVAIPSPPPSRPAQPLPGPRPGDLIAHTKPSADAKALAEVKALADARPIAEVRPVSDARPIAEVRPVSDARPIAEARPVSDARPIERHATPRPSPRVQSPPPPPAEPPSHQNGTASSVPPARPSAPAPTSIGSSSRRTLPEGYHKLREPRFDGPIDLDAHLALLPRDATCKGMFFVDLLRMGSRAATPAELSRSAQIAERRYVGFRDYSAAENMRLTVAVAKAIYPRMPLGEGLRRLGQSTFDAVLGTQVGRSMLGILGPDIERILLAAPKVVKHLVSFGRVSSEKIGAHAYLIRVKEFPCFLETFQVGVLEGALRHCRAAGRVRLATDDLASGLAEVRID